MTRNHWIKALVTLPLLVCGISSARAGVCPTIGASMGCGVIITRSASGSYSIASTGQGPYDGGDDTLVGVVNNGPNVLNSLKLSGSNIFGFDGDGLNAYPGGGSYGPTGYEGPKTGFTIVDANSGTVHFIGGLAVGGTAYFGLEQNLTSATGAPPPITAGTPEPETWALMLVGFGFIGATMRRRVTNVTLA